MKVYNGPDVRTPIFIWAEHLEEDALKQAKALANLPFAEHVALMADAHVGYGMPIGGVLGTKNEILPYGVGGDIGCGMGAFQTGIEAAALSRDDLVAVRAQVLKRVPVGKGARKRGDRFVEEFRRTGLFAEIKESVESKLGDKVLEPEKIVEQIGTLGGGNHFMELQRDEEGRLWVMLHSGSRNMGQQVVRYYHQLAIHLNERWHAGVPKELAFLPADSEEGADYLEKMTLALNFARANRDAMVEAIREAIEAELGPFEVGEVVNIHHNYASHESDGQRNLWVHRKGATLARAGVTGIIPGSMGTASYIVEGLGNPKALNSCSHGAGRVLGRNVAKQTLSLEAERERLGSVVHGLSEVAHLDEAPSAYKNIDEVIAAQSDLVKIKHRLTPLASMKG